MKKKPAKKKAAKEVAAKASPVKASAVKIRKTSAVRSAQRADRAMMKTAPKRTANKVAKKAAKKTASTTPARPLNSAAAAPQPADEGKLSFNHAMIYLKDVERGLKFYREWLGFKLIEDFRHEGKSVYARLRAPGGDGTIALHQAGPGAPVSSDGVRLYFEVRALDDFCRSLQRRGFYFTQLPTMMPWGWRHAYLNDPEGHEISLYWAGENRMKKTVMQAAREAANS
jgi:predicted enzyme related to lactoylglutathione lyase